MGITSAVSVQQKCGRFVIPVFSVLALFLCTGVADAKKKPLPHPPSTLQEKINALAVQLPGVMLVDADPITSQIQKLVLDHMTDWMANRTPTDVEVRRELESVFSPPSLS